MLEAHGWRLKPESQTGAGEPDLDFYIGLLVLKTGYSALRHIAALATLSTSSA
jgi:hypothetical protein